MKNIKIYLIKNTRYYNIFVQKTLFANYMVERIYGSIKNKSYTGTKKELFATNKLAHNAATVLKQKKIKRGYHEAGSTYKD